MNMIVYFRNGNDESIQQHYHQKEYRDDIIVRHQDLYYEVYFFTESSLKYEMRKGGYFSLPGIIVLEEISNLKITTAIKELSELGYFSWFTGKREIPLLNKQFLQKIYDNDLGTFDKKKVFYLDLSY